ncbi:hypothetical protein FJ364_02325 [Candidatus Dependentiae bacterium]|nr:hypothetical protein [Candidatus Dependentiae bacterium]
MSRLVRVLSCALLLARCPLFAFYIDKIDKTPCRKDIKLPTEEEIHKCFSLVKPSFKNECIVTDPLALQEATRDALAFFQRYWNTHKPVIAPQPLSSKILSVQKVKEKIRLREFFEFKMLRFWRKILDLLDGSLIKNKWFMMAKFVQVKIKLDLLVT